ncbi:MAG: hypothetical protein WBD20_07355 [Pirellulaceae bacterium]
MFSFPTFAASRRLGASYLEVQVAMVMLAVGMAGLYSMTVVQTRQSNRLRDLLPATEVAALNQAPLPWQRKLGVYASIDETVVPADPVLPNVAVELVLDNEDSFPQFQHYKASGDTYGWNSWTYSPAYNGNAHYHRSYDNVGSWCQFFADGLPPGEYEVLVTYPALSSLGASITHRIYDDNSVLANVDVNQKISTSDVSYGGRMFDSLGVYPITSGRLKVRVLDGPGSQNYILADAILIRTRRSLNLISVTQDANGGATAVLETVP